MRKGRHRSGRRLREGRGVVEEPRRHWQCSPDRVGDPMLPGLQPHGRAAPHCGQPRCTRSQRGAGWVAVWAGWGEAPRCRAACPPGASPPPCRSRRGRAEAAGPGGSPEPWRGWAGGTCHWSWRQTSTCPGRHRNSPVIIGIISEQQNYIKNDEDQLPSVSSWFVSHEDDLQSCLPVPAAAEAGGAAWC